MAHKKRKLRTGFTTGTAAAAAVKGALIFLLEERMPKDVTIPFLSEGNVTIPVKTLERLDSNQAVCSVIKDGGDDPDVTNKAEIGAIVILKPDEKIRVIYKSGKGVGTVTKKGLEIDVGEPAINKGPRIMIENAVKDVLAHHDKSAEVVVEIFVTDGEKIAEKTLNYRLGIVGGISILGTTGIERPLSHDAYIATIKSSLSVAAASGIKTVYFTTGRRSERFAMDVFQTEPNESFIQIGDFFKASLDSAVQHRMKTVVITVFFGKAVKMAQGTAHTHAAKSSLSLSVLSSWAFQLTQDKALEDHIINCNTAREAFEFLLNTAPAVISLVGGKVISAAKGFVNDLLAIEVVLLDFEGKPVFSSLKNKIEVLP